MWQLTSRRIFSQRFVVPVHGLCYPVSSRKEVCTTAHLPPQKGGGRNLNFEYTAVDRFKTGVTYHPEVEYVC
jgi:hypothetical protein